MASIIIDLDDLDGNELEDVRMSVAKHLYPAGGGRVRSSFGPAAFRDDAIEAMRGDWGYEDGEYPSASDILKGTERFHGYAQGQCVAIAYTFGVPEEEDDGDFGPTKWVWNQIVPASRVGLNDIEDDSAVSKFLDAAARLWSGDEVPDWRDNEYARGQIESINDAFGAEIFDPEYDADGEERKDAILNILRDRVNR